MANLKTLNFYYHNKNNKALFKGRVASPCLPTATQERHPAFGAPLKGRGKGELFNLKSFNSLKKDQTNIKIFKNSSFDSNFNALAGAARLLNLVTLSPASLVVGNKGTPCLLVTEGEEKQSTLLPNSTSLQRAKSRVLRTKREGSYPKISAILRAIRSIRLNRDEWKLIYKYINLSWRKQLPLPFGGGRQVASKPTGGNYSDKQPLSSPSVTVGKGERKKKRRNPFFGCLSLSIYLRLLKASNFFFKRETKRQGALVQNKLNLPTAEGVLRKVGATKIPSAPLTNCRWQRGGGTTIVPSSNTLPVSLPVSRSRNQMEATTNPLLIKQKSYNKIYTYNNIISKNILLRNMKYNFLKSTLSFILKKKIRKMSEILEDKPIKNYVIYSYLKNCIFTPSPSVTTHNTSPACLRQLTLARFNRSVLFYKKKPISPYPLVDSASAPPLSGGKKVASPSVTESRQGARSKLSLNKYKGRKFGSFINYNKIIGFNFNSTFAFPSALARLGGYKANNSYIKDTYKLLFYLFKSMYCLISKPVLKYTNDKVTIQLFYYLNIPKKKIFRLFSISYIKSFKKKWLAQSTAHSSLVSKRFPAFALSKDLPLSFGEKAGTKLNIRWKIRKAISRLKNKIITSASRNQRGEQQPTNKNLLFLLRKFNLSKVYQNKFKLICAILSKKFNKPVELQLIRLHHPYHDSNILVNLLSLNIKNKRKKARVAIQKIYNKKPVKNLNDPNLKTSLPKGVASASSPSVTTRGVAWQKGPIGELLAGRQAGTMSASQPLIPAFLSGLNIKIAGRLMGEPIIPRITTKVFGKGASATGKVNYLDVARITKKNRKGAYTIKITSGQNFF